MQIQNELTRGGLCGYWPLNGIACLSSNLPLDHTAKVDEGLRKCEFCRIPSQAEWVPDFATCAIRRFQLGLKLGSRWNKQ